MIGVAEQFVARLDIKNQKDFLTEEDLVSITLIEDAGNTVPTFDVNFRVHDNEILSLFNEKEILKLWHGKKPEDMVQIPIHITGLAFQRESDTTTLVSLKGLLAMGYVNTQEYKIYEQKSSIDVIKEITGSYFKSDKNNITSSDDTQNWVNFGKTRKSFVTELWLHCNLSNGLPMAAITIESVFR